MDDGPLSDTYTGYHCNRVEGYDLEHSDDLMDIPEKDWVAEYFDEHVLQDDMDKKEWLKTMLKKI